MHKNIILPIEIITHDLVEIRDIYFSTRYTCLTVLMEEPGTRRTHSRLRHLIEVRFVGRANSTATECFWRPPVNAG